MRTTADETDTAGSDAASAPERRPVAAEAGHTVRERWDVLLVVAAGGALGSVARWAVSGGTPAGIRHTPWATFVENLTGGFALGALMVLILDVWPPRRRLRPFLGVGVLGGYTTFSTYMLDTRGLVAAGDAAVALVYLFGTLVGGLLAVWVGILASRLGIGRLRSRHRRRHAAAQGRRRRIVEDQLDERSAG